MGVWTYIRTNCKRMALLVPTAVWTLYVVMTGQQVVMPFGGELRSQRGAYLTLVAGCGLLLGYLLWVSLRADRKKLPPSRIFLLLFIPLSLAMMLVLPLGQVPDESRHFQRIWTISQGNLLHEPHEIASGPSYLSQAGNSNSLTATWRAFTHPSTGEMAVAFESNTAIYPITGYLPQAIALRLASLLTSNPVVLLFAARLGAWLTTTVLLWYAIRIIPEGKTLLLAVTLLPMALQECIGAGADGLIFSAAMALLALVLSLRRQPRALRRREKILLTVLVAAVATVKLLYFPLVALVCFLPQACFGGRKQRKCWVAALLSMAFALVLLWGLWCLCKIFLVGADPHAAQVLPAAKSTMGNPLTFLWLMVKAIGDQWIAQYPYELAGQYMAWLQYTTPVYGVVPVMMAFAFVWKGDHPLPASESRSLKLG